MKGRCFGGPYHNEMVRFEGENTLSFAVGGRHGYYTCQPTQEEKEESGKFLLLLSYTWYWRED